jgi:hypothetical protein
MAGPSERIGTLRLDFRYPPRDQCRVGAGFERGTVSNQFVVTFLDHLCGSLCRRIGVEIGLGIAQCGDGLLYSVRLK